MSNTLPRPFELPLWSFDVTEFSAGVYRATGRDTAGRTVQATGVDPKKLIDECKTNALQLVRGAGSKSSQTTP